MLVWRFSIGFLLTVQTTHGQEDSCSFSAESVGYVGVLSAAVNQTTFICEGSGEYLTEIRMATGWWIDGLQVLCSSGEESPWFGDPDGGVFAWYPATGGWTAISVSLIYISDTSFPCLPYVFVYDDEEGRKDGAWVGPFGGVVSSQDYSDDEWTSDCGFGSWANGVTIIDDEKYVLGLQLECQSAVGSVCPVPEGLLVPTSTPSPTTAPVVETPSPTTAPTAKTPSPTTVPLVETPSPEIRVEFGGDCTVNGCDANLCCSETGECGGTSSYCRDGRCCASDDESDCELGTNQCLIETEEPVAWYESPTFVGISTAFGLVAAIGGGIYAFYRHMKCCVRRA